jgi:hypothetical protein
MVRNGNEMSTKFQQKTRIGLSNGSATSARRHHLTMIPFSGLFYDGKRQNGERWTRNVQRKLERIWSRPTEMWPKLQRLQIFKKTVKSKP